ncbi:MAG: hypothetical protein OXD29_05255 [Roseovarius sp.]|nr:hypothetical protein [Roseovarius sp.]MCY4207344.1 hypothetical protein [Roseovarius sp.]MCY4316125.1 hypothetical protein [Roseovarius sp.]
MPLIIMGIIATMAGLVMLIRCILRVRKLRNAGLNDEDMRRELNKVVPLNTGALLVSVTGLLLIVVGGIMG